MLGVGAGNRAKTLWGWMGSTLSSENRREGGLAGWPTLTRGPETSPRTFRGLATKLTYEVEVVVGRGGESKISKIKAGNFLLSALAFRLGLVTFFLLVSDLVCVGLCVYDILSTQNTTANTTAPETTNCVQKFNNVIWF